MFTSLAITALVASFLVRADPNPNTPGPNAVYNAGAPCPIAWDVDPTGLWTSMNIQLMTGDNLHMIALTSVATVDATTSTSFSWTCPQVTPNSAIYFYQFKSPASNNTLWTTRFAIASATGATTPPANATQPDGRAIPWGVGVLANPVLASLPPSGGSLTATSSIPPNTPSFAMSPSMSVPGTTRSSSSSTRMAFSSPAATTISSSLPSGGSSSAASAAMVSLSVDGRIFRAMIYLSVAAFGFTVVL